MRSMRAKSGFTRSGKTQSGKTRSGFTLVELLMVIAIIVLLVGLLAAGIIPLLSKGPEITTVNEIRQLEIAVQNFKNKYHVWPPSKIRLYPNYTDYNLANPNDAESLAYINQLWPRIGAFTGVIWNGMDINKHELDGDQCLVFFLGGPAPLVGGIFGPQGFSTNPTNPVNLTGDRVGPFYTFDQSRLYDRKSGENFPSYYDPWNRKIPYVYFSSGKTVNGYNSGGAWSHTITIGSETISPYYEVLNTRYPNPNSYQIISAGKDGLFGTTTQWRAPSASADAPDTGNSFDNQVNFHPSKLGVP
ncbi:MAG: type II secretion system protein [Planctomycetes bacterium]|nr:type II secretion system protein [Planctomycetota bacterium]